MSSLDQIESLRSVDRSNMMEILSEFPQRVAAAFAQSLPDFNFDPAKARSMAVVGLGGSAIGGDLAIAAFADRLTKPVAVVRRAVLPAWMGENTLVVAVSYSGNTAEVLSAYRQARRRGCTVIAVANGGTLAEHAERDGVPLVHVSHFPQPRLAVGDLTIAVMKIFAYACGIALEGMSGAVVSALGEWRLKCIPAVPIGENPAKLLAYKLLDRLPAVVGGGVLVPLAHRWKTQLNENAKSMCVAEELPELFHNTIEGVGTPSRFVDDCVWVVLEAEADRTVPESQLDRLEEFLKARSVSVERIAAREDNLMAALWHLLYFGDWVSFYLACLYEVDPMPVPTIEAFKSQTPMTNDQ